MSLITGNRLLTLDTSVEVFDFVELLAEDLSPTRLASMRVLIVLSCSAILNADCQALGDAGGTSRSSSHAGILGLDPSKALPDEPNIGCSLGPITMRFEWFSSLRASEVL
jgi:hypothetical protein